MGSMTVVPGRFDKNATQVRVARLGDRAATGLGAAGAFRGDEPRVAHDLACALEAAECPELGGQRDGGELRDTTQGLQRVDDGFDMDGCRLDGAVDGAFESLDALRLVIDLHDVIEQGGVLLGVRLQCANPFPPVRGPGSAAFARSLAIPQQVLAQTVPGAQLVLFGGFASPNQIAQRLVLGVGDPDRAEVAAAVGASEFLGISAVGLDAVPGHLGYERGSDDVAVHAEPGELPVQDVAGGTCLVADPKARGVAELFDELADRLRTVGDRAQRAHVAPFGDRDRDGLGVYVHANKSCYRCHHRLLSSEGVFVAVPARACLRDAAVPRVIPQARRLALPNGAGPATPTRRIPAREAFGRHFRLTNLAAHGVERPSRGAAGASRSEHALEVESAARRCSMWKAFRRDQRELMSTGASGIPRGSEPCRSTMTRQTSRAQAAVKLGAPWSPLTEAARLYALSTGPQRGRPLAGFPRWSSEACSCRTSAAF